MSKYYITMAPKFDPSNKHYLANLTLEPLDNKNMHVQADWTYKKEDACTILNDDSAEIAVEILRDFAKDKYIINKHKIRERKE